MYDLRFWKASIERAVKTFAQTLVALIGTTAVTIVDLDWMQMLGVSATATLLSVLTSLASANFGSTGPSLADETVEPDPIIVEVVPEKVTKPRAVKK
jgi:hypothetical protein